MSETATKPTAPPLDTVVVKRNEVELPFVNTVVERGPAESRGKQYLAPDVNKENLFSLVIPWIGVDETTALLKNLLRKRSSGWYDENVEDDGTFNAIGFADMAASFSARGESIPDLLKQIQEISDEQQNMLNNPSFGTHIETIDGKVVNTDIVAVQALAAKIIGLRAAINNKRRMTKEEKEAKEAAEKAQATS